MEQYRINNYDLMDSTSTIHSTQEYQEPKLRYVSNSYDLNRATDGSAGYDLYADNVDMGTLVYGTGIHVQIPEGWVGLVYPRSSSGLKGMKLKNTVGVIDSDYRGEIKLAIDGWYPDLGDKIAQLVITPCLTLGSERMASIDDLTDTERGDGCFGSTGG